MTRLLLLLAGLLLVFAATSHAPRAQAAAFVVSNTANAGPGSLRQAITDANTSPGVDSISLPSQPSGAQITPWDFSALKALHAQAASAGAPVSAGGSPPQDPSPAPAPAAPPPVPTADVPPASPLRPKGQ
jgi:hypothetical protein